MKIDLADPKHRLIFIITIIVLSAIIFTVIGYFGAKNVFEAREELNPSPTSTATISQTASLTAASSPQTSPAPDKTSEELDKLRQEKSDIQKQLDEKTNELSSKNAGMATIEAYNNFLEYMTHVIDAHDGFSGWTEAEYQIAREKAEATGNDEFVNTVDTAWNDTSIDVTTRVINVYRGIINGIRSGIN